MIEKCNREAKSITTSENKYKANPSLNDHQIFEGLDNSMPFNNEKLRKETYKEIFLGCTRNGTQKTSLKKQLNYINHTKSDFDLISKKKHHSMIQNYKLHKNMQYSDARRAQLLSRVNADIKEIAMTKH